MRSFALFAIGLGVCACATEREAPVARAAYQEMSRQGRQRISDEDRERAPASRIPAFLDLETALATAETVHPELVAARARVEAADGRALQAGLYPNPVGVLRMESAPFSDRVADDAEYVAGVSVPLDLGGQIAARRRTREMERQQALFEQAATRRHVRSAVQGAFAAVLYAERALEIRVEHAEMSRTKVGVVEALVSAGEALQEDLARAELDLVESTHEVEKARLLRDLAAGKLAGAMGDSALRFESVEGSLEATIELPALVDVAGRLSEDPDVMAAAVAADTARARIELAEAERIPQVELDLFYRRLQFSREDTFDVGLRIPLPLFDRHQGRLREAKAEAERAVAEARSVHDRRYQQVRAGHAVLSTALASVRVLRDDVLPRIETVLKAVEARYTVGDVRLVEVIAIRRKYAAARLSYLEALRDVLEAWAELSAFVETK